MNKFDQVDLQWFAGDATDQTKDDKEQPEPNKSNEPDKTDEKVKESIDLDKIKKFLETNEDDRHKLFFNYKPFQSLLDIQKKQHLETWKTNNIDNMIKEKELEWRAQYLPEETPDQKRLKIIEIERAQEKKERNLLERKNQGIIYANSIGLNIGDKIDVIAKGCETHENIIGFLDYLKEWGNKREKDGANKIIAQHGRTPSTGDTPGAITLENFEARMKAEMAKHGHMLDDTMKFYQENAKAITDRRKKQAGG